MKTTPKQVTQYGANLYEEAMYLEKARIHKLHELHPDQKLDVLKKEIITRGTITKREIFMIGQILDTAKPICKQTDLSFQKWIKDSFDFSLKTANNFMNYYKGCLGMPEIAEHLPTSVSYKFFAPSFPTDLRDYIANNLDLEKLTNKKISVIKLKHKEGGVELVRQYTEDIMRSYNDNQEIKFVITECLKGKRMIEELGNKLESKYNIDEKIDQYDYLQPEAAEIITQLYETIKKLNFSLHEAIEVAKEKRMKIQSQLQDNL